MEKLIKLIELDPDFDELLMILRKCGLKDEVQESFYLKLSEEKDIPVKRWVEVLKSSSLTERLKTICLCKISGQISDLGFGELLGYYQEFCGVTRFRELIVKEISDRKDISIQEWVGAYPIVVSSQSSSSLSTLILKRLPEASGNFDEWVDACLKTRFEPIEDIALSKLSGKSYKDKDVIKLKQLVNAYCWAPTMSMLSHLMFKEISEYVGGSFDEWLDVLKKPKLPNSIRQIVLVVLQSEIMVATKEQWRDFLNELKV